MLHKHSLDESTDISINDIDNIDIKTSNLDVKMLEEAITKLSELAQKAILYSLHNILSKYVSYESWDEEKHDTVSIMNLYYTVNESTQLPLGMLDDFYKHKNRNIFHRCIDLLFGNGNSIYSISYLLQVSKISKTQYKATVYCYLKCDVFTLKKENIFEYIFDVADLLSGGSKTYNALLLYNNALQRFIKGETIAIVS